MMHMHQIVDHLINPYFFFWGLLGVSAYYLWPDIPQMSANSSLSSASTKPLVEGQVWVNFRRRA